MKQADPARFDGCRPEKHPLEGERRLFVKEKIYTIPLNEAFDADTECPFCYLYERLEQSRVEYTVGASMMEPDSRMVTNEKGFCNRHLRQMEKCQQALSLALVLDTHLNEVVKKLDTLKGEISALTSPKKGLFQKAPDTVAAAEHLAAQTERILESCAICDYIRETQERYMDTFFLLYRTEADFKQKYQAGKGFCLEHFSMLVKLSGKHLKPADQTEFLKTLYEKEMENLRRINEEVNYFTKKFDYRFQNADWKNSKDAPQRTILKLVGK